MIKKVKIKYQSLILEEMEEDIENQMCKHIETYMCDMCNKTGILIYFVPMYIDWFENIIELKTENWYLYLIFL